MAGFLTREWLEEARRLAREAPAGGGPSVSVQFVVNGGPTGSIRYYFVYRAGRLDQADLGDLEDPDVTLTQSYEDAVELHKGTLDTNAAFMEGRIKVAGNMAKLMSVLAMTSSPDHAQNLARLDAVTEY